MAYRIDEIDRRILYHLEADARNISAPAIADELDVSARTIRNRIRKLEDHGILRGYHANVDYERVDNRITNLFICNVPVPEREQYAKDVLEISGVVRVRELMTGRGNLHVTVVGTDTNDINRIAGELSDRGLDIEDEALLQRRHFHPYHPFSPEDGGPKSMMTDFRRLAGDAEVVNLTVGEDASVVGNSLEEIAGEGLIGDDSLVIAIERGDQVLTPKGHTTIQAGDLVTIFSREGIVGELVSSFTGDRR
ncbi:MULTISPECIES: Lrp/AsnC family transcriptional regulator [unclassified Haladaptatus]|uniref:Lrp/AsnC family transcriptional regulator n=1 Tax=unclassified Haladaptatus TaxID=2622732 RepID=UPI0023E8664A|nr:MULTISPECIES: winged helix-turn-helix transcriptional regulator [unclassified Haladaptatus]